MTEGEVFNKLIDIIKKLFDGSKVFDCESITLDSKPIENLGFSSMDLIMVSFAIEREFNIDITDLNMASFSTIKDVINYIKERVDAK